jgi:hypothetical protein
MAAFTLVSALTTAPSMLLHGVFLKGAVLARALGKCLGNFSYRLFYFLLLDHGVLESLKLVLEGTTHDRGTLSCRLLRLHLRDSHGGSEVEAESFSRGVEEARLVQAITHASVIGDLLAELLTGFADVSRSNELESSKVFNT